MKDLPFIGRKEELKRLYDMTCKKTSSLVALRGRRRIGKSRLVEEFASRMKCRFLSFGGLAPSKNTTAEVQKEEFCRQMSVNLDQAQIKADDWGNIFSYLAKETRDERVVILFDEIAWMGSKDPTFLGKLKNAWDLEFKKNPELMLILCGSVSTWIEENILGHTGFMGRFSLVLDLKELTLHESAEFLNKVGFCNSPYEICKILSVTGGIPRYLEEINPDKSADENIKDMCFKSDGILFREFDDIFSDIFEKRSSIYEKITRGLIDGRKELSEIAEILGLQKSGYVSSYMSDLVMSGFIKRDYVWSVKEKAKSRLGFYRLSDNYLRFYLKYIEPNKEKIAEKHFNNKALSTLPGFDSIMALQFENLVLGNSNMIIQKLNISFEDVARDNPYFQRSQPSRGVKGCQIDYMIQSMSNILYACEIKFSRRKVGSGIIKEMETKIQNLVRPKGFAVIPVLIHINGVSESVINSDLRFRIIDFGEMMR